MSQFFHIHPDNPQGRLIKQAAQIVHDGGIVALPTDSGYALVSHLDDKTVVEKLRRIRGIDDKYHLTLLCRDLREIAQYARVDNRQYRLLKATTPGPYTFILDATKEVPRRLSHPSRKSISRLERQIELVIGGGACSMEPTTVIDLTSDEPVLVRQGRGDASIFGL